MNVLDEKYIGLVENVINYKLSVVSKDKEATMFYQSLMMKLINKEDFTIEELSKIKEGMIHYSKTLKNQENIISTNVIAEQLSDHLITEFKNERNKER
jgi:hypothetical protein